MNSDKPKQDDTKWNGTQPIEQTNQVNEGFSGENLASNYDPSAMKKETETDENGNIKIVDRARHSNLQDEDTPMQTGKTATGNEKIEKTAENRDRNYDVTPNRYPVAHPENQQNRGNIDLDKE